VTRGGRALALAALLAGVVAASPAPQGAPDAALTGFTARSSAWQREYERRFLALPRPEECGEILRELTRTPHVAGTAGNARVADWLAEEYRKAGFDVSMPSYDVLLSYPKTARLEIVGEPSVELARGEPPIPSDPDTDLSARLEAAAIPEAALPWNAYAPSADVVGEVVYVNRGAAEDYEALSRMGVDVRGRIGLARYFGGYRGGKSLEAEKRGLLALIVYSDPYDDGWYQGPVYPDGPWGPAGHFQRGANVYDFLVPGDPLTPGWASTKDARRIPASEAESLPKMPMMPISARDAAEVLRRIGGKNVPGPGWQGLAINETMRTGPGPRAPAHANREHPRAANDPQRHRDAPRRRGGRAPGPALEPLRRVGLRRRGPVVRNGDAAVAGARPRPTRRRGLAAAADDHDRGVGRGGVHAHRFHRVGRGERGRPEEERRRLHQRR
jgi:N-acetylated-alpha-linked acidic dipeptidase